MRILMLGWELPPHNSGGLGVACYELSRALANQGMHISFVLPHAKQPDEPSHDFMDVHHASPLTSTSDLNAYTGSLDAIRAAQKHYQRYVTHFLSSEEPPQVIHAHDWLTFEAGVHAKELSGSPLIAHVHATEYDRAGGQSGNPYIHEIEQHGLLMADRIIAVSQATKNLIVEKYSIPSDKIEVVHNSVNEDDFTQDEASTKTLYTYARSLQAEGTIVVVTVGRLTIQKGLAYFLQAAAKATERYDKFLFIVAGDGEQCQELVRMSADYGIADKVLFTGFVRGRAWRELYDVADIFVMNSVSEPFGLTALEAAVQHTAISLSHQSGVSEVLKNVFKHNYWEIDRLADELIAMATSEGLRQELADGSQRDFQHVSWQRAADQCLSQYKLVGAHA